MASVLSFLIRDHFGRVANIPNGTPVRRFSREQRRALEMLASAPRGISEQSLVVAHGFAAELLAELVLPRDRSDRDRESWRPDDQGLPGLRRNAKRDQRAGTNWRPLRNVCGGRSEGLVRGLRKACSSSCWLQRCAGIHSDPSGRKAPAESLSRRRPPPIWRARRPGYASPASRQSRARPGPQPRR